ncbi:Tetraketide alpha-pyrone reductase 1 [Vitis vinifera]|uniref:Tetraketide alpha-pyrone reductase 1 n=1 Tax=Vitis vinifera TaxID=29760 RepID=A0A438GEK2_VITVI|nr:Tetraketide alpha-pyrone reductase 1 [Vitis vinifera]
MSVAVAEKVVCVTGAAGFIASWLVKLLLLRGYTVKATLRNPDDPTKTEHLLALEGAKERLHLFKADLLEEGSFDSIVEGCEGVFHTASPVLLEVANPKVELIDPAVNGTLNVLRSCTKVPSIRRVVVTSSIVATIFNGKTLTPDVIVDETWFSDPAFLWYVLSKTLAEEAAWKFAKENGIDLVTMNPGFVIGPFLQPTINLTMEIILNLINGGAQTFPSSTYRWVDVRDVANAHVQAFEISSASGRYCLVERVTYCSEAIKILQELYPALHLPQKNADDEPPMATYQISKEKVKSLAIDFIPLEVSLKDTMENLKEMNFIKL